MRLIANGALSALCALQVLATCACAQKPDEIVIEAESKLAAGDLQVLADPKASGGKAVAMSRDWQPLLIAAPPARGDEFTIWVRYARKPVLLKAATKDGQKDLQCLWDSPNELTWKRAGRFSRAQIGDNVFVIRGGDGGEGPLLDCIVFSTDDAYNPQNETAAPKNAAPKIVAQNANSNANAGAPPEAAAIALGAQDAPKGTLIEAEANPTSGDLQVLADNGASGKSAVSMEREWQPLLRADLPPTGDAFKIWVRHKSGPVLIKADLPDGQKDLKWVWDAPENFKWTDVGTYARADIGKGVVVIRGGKDQKTPVLDAVVFAPDTVKTLPPFQPDAALAPLNVVASVNWNRVVGQMKPAMWGINDYEVTNPQTAADPKFQQLLGEFQTPLIRIHHGSFATSWTNADTKTWDVEKIRAGLKSSTGFGKAKLMMNISHWPGWLSKNEILTPQEEDQFAALMGELARVMRDEIKRPVDYWELTNEFDTTYERNNQLPALWRLFNKCVAAVRKVEPKAKIGGPALTWPKPLWLDGFFQNCGQNIDFVTWHNYASGDIYDSNEMVFSKAPVIAGMAQDVLNAAKKYVPNRKLEFFLTELNIKWVWDPIERRHGNNIGALFLASTLHQLAKTNIDGVTMWHAKGGSYGLIDGDNTMRSTGHLYRWSKSLPGRVMEAKSGNELLEIIPIQRGQNKSLLLLNKANRGVTIPNSGQVLASAKWRAQRIDAGGLVPQIEVPKTGAWTLPGYSLTLLTTD